MGYEYRTFIDQYMMGEEMEAGVHMCKSVGEACS